MKKMKKWISAILSIAMVAGLVGSPALEAQAAVPDIVDADGWSITVDYDAIGELFEPNDQYYVNTGVFEGDNYTCDWDTIGDCVTVTGLDFNEIGYYQLAFTGYDWWEGEWTFSDEPEDMYLTYQLGMMLSFVTEPDPDKKFYEATYLDKLTANATIEEDECYCAYVAGEDHYYAEIFLDLGCVFDVLPGVVSNDGWGINVDKAGIAALLKGKENTHLFGEDENWCYDSDIYDEYLAITGIDPDYIARDECDFGILVYDEETHYLEWSETDIDEDSIIVLQVEVELAYPYEKYFHNRSYLTKFTTNASVFTAPETNFTCGYYADVFLNLGRLGDLLNPNPNPNPDPDPTYIEWNTDDPNVTKLMWHGGKSTYATITETKDSTEVKFTGIGWFAIPDLLDYKFQQSGKDTNVTYPYKGYTVSVKIPVDKVKRTGVAWYGPEYFPSLYMEEGYVTVTDYLGREVDSQVIITKKN